MNVVEKMKQGKATGPFEVDTKIIVASGKIGVEIKIELFQRVLDGKEIPNKWKSSQVIGTGGKRRKILQSSKSAALSINNLKCFTLSGISLEVKIFRLKKTETHVQQKQSYINIKLQKRIYKGIRVT